MKIVFLMDQMYLHGGAERILSQKINYLIGYYKYDITLITTEQKNRPAVYELDKKLHQYDLGINYDRWKSYFHRVNLLKTMRHYFRLKRLLKQIQPDVIISVSISPEQYFLPYIHTKTPKIKEFHASRHAFQTGNSLKHRLEKAFEKYDSLVVLNLDEAAHYSNKNIVVIPNFTEFRTNAIPEKQKTVIAAGRIAPVKQFDELIRIWKMAHADFPDWTLKIFGDGERNGIDDLNRLIKELDLSGSVLLLPSVADIQHEMQQASVYAMTSATECFPMVLLEAQASLLPVVSYDCPYGPRHIITDATGMLVAPDDKAAFASALGKLMGDAEMRTFFGQNAARNAARFSKETIMGQWNDLFISLKDRT